MADVVEINSAEQLEDYRLAWTALLVETPDASLFQTLDWLLTYWRWFGSEQRLRVLVIRSAGRPIGIVPLCVSVQRYQVGKVRVLTYPLSDWGTSYGPIGPDRTACLFAALKHLQATPRDWDMLDLRWMGGDASRTSLCQALQASGWAVSQSNYQETSLIELEPSDWPGYRSHLTKKWRHEVTRQQNRLRRLCQVQINRHRPVGAALGDAEPRWDLYEQCLSIAQQSWQGKSTTGNTLSHSHVRGFLRDCHQIAAKLGMLDMMVLKLDGQPAAFQYNYVYDGRLFGLRMGYDRAFAQYGAGKALLGWMIEGSFRRGDRTIDLGAGEYPFKRRFRTGTATSQRYTYYPWSTLRGQGVRLTQWIKSRWPTERALVQK
ncbi:MAG: GNAT family N-acetyltransferase [Planctomycetota bacterium]